MLQLKSIKKQFTDFTCAFTLEVRCGECVVILGESGSGKSTLLNLIAGFLEPDCGEILWQSEKLNSLQPHKRPLTTLFQDNNLFAHLSVFTNLAIGIDPRAQVSALDIKRIDEVLDRVGLADYKNRMPPSLSGGQQQRIALARCLLRSQPLLLLDEPFIALDSDTRKSTRLLVDQIVRENQLTLLLVTHDRDDAKQLNARTLHCKNGQLYNSDVFETKMNTG